MSKQALQGEQKGRRTTVHGVVVEVLTALGIHIGSPLTLAVHRVHCGFRVLTGVRDSVGRNVCGGHACSKSEA